MEAALLLFCLNPKQKLSKQSCSSSSQQVQFTPAAVLTTAGTEK